MDAEVAKACSYVGSLVSIMYEGIPTEVEDLKSMKNAFKAVIHFGVREQAGPGKLLNMSVHSPSKRKHPVTPKT